MPTATLARRARARAKVRESAGEEIVPSKTLIASTRNRPSDTGRIRTRRSQKRCESYMPLSLRNSFGACKCVITSVRTAACLRFLFAR